MPKHILFKQKFHKWYDDDLWGYYAVTSKNSKALDYLYNSFQHNYIKRGLLKKSRYFLNLKNFRSLYKQRFLYKVNTGEIEFLRKKRSFRAKHYFNLLKFRAFYGNIKIRPFKSLLNTSSKNQNLATPTVPLFFENRLDILLYRTNLFSSIFYLKQIICHKNIYVNGKLVINKNYSLNKGDIITIKPSYYAKIFPQFLKKLRQNVILHNFPTYLEINYKIGSITLLRLPSVKEIPYPFGISASTMLHRFKK